MKTNPSVEDINKQITGLSPAKRALLELRLKKNNESVRGPDTIPRRPNRDTAPLSFAQQRLWFLDQLEPGKSSYNVPMAKRISGPLSLEALKRALDEIITRHEVLRTSFLTVDAEPTQVIAEPAPVPLPLTDISHLPEPEREPEARRLINIEVERPFDLAEKSLFRAALLRLSNDDHILVITMHHIVCDGWSLGLLSNELNALYVAFCANEPSPLADLPIQFSDYALWQREWMQGEELDRQLSYWKRQLSGNITALDLPADRPRPALPSYRGASQTMMLSMSSTDKLKNISQQQGATLFMTLLAAFQSLLSRYSGQSDIIVGSPIANRNRVETEKLVGFFANTLVLRTDLSGDPTFLQLLGRVREVALGAYAHQDLPFEKLVEELQPERTLNRNPLFDVMFALQNAPTADAGSPSAPIRRWAIEDKITRFDLEVYLHDTPKGIFCRLVYSTDLFDEQTIERMIGHFQLLLESIASDPGQRLSRLQMLSQPELHQLLTAWNDTRSEFESACCIHHLFERQATLTPDGMAVRYDQQQLSYADLNRRANQLAHYLRSLGVGPDTLAAICVERGIDMVVGLLAILKAGGAYVPLDPAYPKARLDFMLKDSAAMVLLTQEHLLEALPETCAEVVCLDKDWRHLVEQSCDNPATKVEVDNLAYVMYTSGSTGTPKGVLGSHGACLNRFNWMWKAYPFEEGEICCQKTSLSFGDSVWEIFGPLLRGIPIVVIANDEVKEPDRLVERLAENRVTRLVLVPSLLRAILDSAGDLDAMLPRLKRWTSSGESLSVELSRRFAERLPGRMMLNLYGSSEVAADVTCFEVSQSNSGEGVLIGLPISNTRVYVLDSHLVPVPVGVTGELYVGGKNLGRGYLNRLDLTAERFIPDPYSEEPGARMFKTGDLVRRLGDGNIEFLGRSDNQVKVRGFRIELGEVEAALGQHTAVSANVVALTEYAPGEKRLFAYVVPSDGQTPNAGDLRNFLKERLPNYMVPSGFMTLDELPLTPSGKVNRLALPAPDYSRPELNKGFAAPRNAEEQVIADIWKQALGLDQVGIYDNFFDLGGHSMLAVRVMSQIEKAYGRKIPLSILYQGATVEHLAGMLRPEAEPYAHLTLLKINQGNSYPPFFCVSAPNVNALGYVSLARHLDEDQPVYALQSAYRRRLETEYTSEEVEGLAAEYVKAMRELQPEGPYMFGGMCAGALIAFDMARQLDLQGQEVALLALFDTWDVKTLTRLWYLYDYTCRLKRFLRQSPKKQIGFTLNKARRLSRGIAAKLAAGVQRQERPVQDNRWQTAYKTHQEFVPKVYHGRATLFRIRKRPYYRIPDEKHGWGKRVLGGIDVHYVPGEHATIFREPHVQVFARKLNASINEAKWNEPRSDSRAVDKFSKHITVLASLGLGPQIISQEVDEDY